MEERVWVPDSIQISKELIRAELDQKVPVGTTMATAAFSMTGANKETAKKVVEMFSLDRNAARVAWIFLSQGKIVTSDGEILTETSVAASPATVVEPNPPTVPSASTTDTVNEAIRTYFPNWVDATAEQAQTILGLAKDMSLVDDALFVFANGNQEIKNPITLLIWKLKNSTAEQIRQERAIIDKKGRSGDSIVRETMRKAEAEIPSLPTPQATTEGTDLLRKLKEQVEKRAGT